MPYTVEVHRRAQKFLRSVTDKGLYRRLREAIDSLAENPRQAGSVKLSGSADLFRVRVGDYRILYQIQDRVLVVLIVDIGHRRGIYR